MRDDDLDLLHVGHYPARVTDVTAYSAHAGSDVHIRLYRPPLNTGVADAMMQFDFGDDPTERLRSGVDLM